MQCVITMSRLHLRCAPIAALTLLAALASASAQSAFVGALTQTTPNRTMVVVRHTLCSSISAKRVSGLPTPACCLGACIRCHLTSQHAFCCSDAMKDCEGPTPGRLVIQSVIPVPGSGQSTYVNVRNAGGKVANLTGRCPTVVRGWLYFASTSCTVYWLHAYTTVLYSYPGVAGHERVSCWLHRNRCK